MPLQSHVSMMTIATCSDHVLGQLCPVELSVLLEMVCIALCMW